MIDCGLGWCDAVVPYGLPLPEGVWSSGTAEARLASGAPIIGAFEVDEETEEGSGIEIEEGG